MESCEDIIEYTIRGTVRKRKPKKTNNYFTQDTEDAIVEYLSLTDQRERNAIYNERIEYSFNKLVENIIHTFKFYYTDVNSALELKHEVVTFLLEKLHLYNQDKGKAFSYFGTIAKRWLIVYNMENYSKLKEKAKVEETDNDSIILDSLTNSYTNDVNLSEFMDLYIKYIDKHIDRIFPDETDKKVVDSIMELFRKREHIDIFNKKAIYIYIKELVDVDTLYITNINKRLKKIKERLFNEYYQYGDITI